MKISERTYQRLVKTIAALLLVALFVPSGLHAKQLVDFCKPAPIEQSMAANHSCCDEPADNESSDAHQNHHCEWGFICACNISQSELIDTEWVISNNDFTVTLTESETLTLHIPSTIPIRFEQQFRIGHHQPPLWLLYDTYLI